MSLFNLLYAVNHVFLPPKLPQADDQTVGHDKFLCEHVRDSIVAYQTGLPAQERSQWDPILRLVENLACTQEFNVLSPETIANQISCMRHGDTVAFLIRAQNAGVILRKFSSRTLFEAFEVAPPAGEVMGAKGKLLCSYPGPAVIIPSDVIDDACFRTELASFLSQMHADVLDSAATTKKAGSTVVEERDTAHPRYITQLLTGILRGMGRAAEVTRIRKRIADDVLWKDARCPWRRSSLWLVLRVALQTTLYDEVRHHADYKAITVFAMTRILQDVLPKGLPSDVIFCMRAKVSRRLYKLGSSAPQFLQKAVRAAGEAVEQVLQAKWLQVQNHQAASPRWAPDVLDIIADTHLSLSSSKSYLDKALSAESSATSSVKFDPCHPPRSRDTFSPELLNGNEFVSLADFELLVQDDLDRWLQNQIHNTSNSACVKLAACIEAYHKSAIKLYAGNPEDVSLMLLTIIELWVALDKLVVAEIPLLAEYSPEIPHQVLELLLLCKAKSIRRLALAIDYIRQRHLRARSGFSVFNSKWSSDSFGVRYFQQSPSHRSLKERIEADATATSSRKRRELQDKNTKHDMLRNEARSLACQYAINSRGQQYHVKRCRKCSLEKEMRKLSIDVYEWPLPSNPHEAQAAVFELDSPAPFAVWRSTTHAILYDIFTSRRSSNSRADAPISLKDYISLQRYQRKVAPQGQRIALASTTKSFCRSHYRIQSIPTSEEKICVNNGLRLALIDSSKNVWAAGCFADVNIADMCTFQIPSCSPYHCLQYTVNATTHTHNDVIARQSDCHKDINLHEYVAFAGLRAGGRLQWLNIARELPSRSLTFRCEEVVSLLKQAAWQIGPLSPDKIWEWHRELADTQFGLVLLHELGDLMQNIKTNWLESPTMRAIIILTCRLLTSAKDSSVVRLACSVLREARGVTLQWMRQLNQQLQENEDEGRMSEIQQCLCEMAVTCRSTYNVDAVHATQLLTSTQDVAILLECAIVVHDNQSPDLSKLPPCLKFLLECDRRLSHHLEPALSEMIKADRTGLDRALSSIWTAYRAGTEWRHRAPPNDRWITCQTRSGSGEAPQLVDLNLLDGHLLIDGKPLARLPHKIICHPTYVRIFGRKLFDIIPSDMLGCQYATRTEFQGYQVFFTLKPKGGPLVIRTRRNTEVLELIPHDQFSGDLPAMFLSEFTHWLNLSSGEIEFRPRQNLWTSTQSNWWIRSFTSGCAIMQQGSQRLVDIRSPTFKMISRRLSPLECATYLKVTYHSDVSPLLSVELPRFRLSFFLNDSGQLESHNLPGMLIDENQSSGTMFGLANQMILRAGKPPAAGLSPSRCVLIPFGKINFKEEDLHTVVTIDTTSQERVVYHKYQIDNQLGRLVSNVSLFSKLYKALLHAVTSYCLPDPLTGCTGTEESLNELRSASCWSFQTLNPEEVEILRQISSLSPSRKFYPPHKTVMQTVRWSELPAIAQHDGYLVITEKILEHARCLLLSQGKNTDTEFSSNTKMRLLERAANRNAVYYPESFRSLFLSDADAEYRSRDLELDGEASTCALSAMVKAWSMEAHTSCQLFDLMKQWRDVSGPMQDFCMSYSPNWLNLDLSAVWMSLYDLCRKSDVSANRWQLAFSLCAFQYGAPHRSQLAGILLAFATIPDFRELDPPPWASYDLSHGYRAKRSALMEICRCFAIQYEDSPAIVLPPKPREDEAQVGQRRYSFYETQCDKEISSAVKAFMSQWPSDLASFEPSASCFSFLDVTRMTEAVRNRFGSWYHNKQLSDHVKKVQFILDQHAQRSHRSVPSYAFTPCASKPSSISAFLSHDSLFLRATPHPQSHPPTTLTLDSLYSQCDPSRDSWTSGSHPLQSPYAGLQSILEEFRSNVKKPFHQLYGHSLAASQDALRTQVSEPIPDRLPLSLHAHLLENRDQWAAHLRHVIKSIQQSLRPTTPLESVLFTAGLWPRLTAKSLLSMLRYGSYQGLSIPWRQALMSFAQTLLSFQRAVRLTALAQSQSIEELWRELQNGGQDAMEEPDWLLIQVDSDFHARPIQIRCAEEMISPSSQRNSVFQLNMGEGKSSVIVPLASSRLADGQKLARVVVLKALANQMFHLLVERLSGLASRRIFYMPFSRAEDVGIDQATAIQSLYEECIRVGGILVVQPEHILSFKLMGIDHSLRSNKTHATTRLLKTQRWLERRSRDILDESDEILHVRYQLVYTVGHQQPIEHYPDRWVIVQQVLSLARKHAVQLQKLFPECIEVGDSSNGRFPHIRILKGALIARLTSQIADDVLRGCLPNCSIGLLPGNIRRIVVDFMCKIDIAPDSAALIQGHFTGNSVLNTLLLLRGLLAHGILGYVLKDRRWRVDYGLDTSRTLLAVPYRAKDVPALRAEFGHPDVAIALTCLSYYYQGLSDEQVRLCFHRLLKLDNPTLEYEHWVHVNPNVPQELRELRAVNVRDTKKLKDDLLPHFYRNHAVIDFFVSQIVFPKEAKEFPQKIATSGWDIAECKEHPTTGFSGTNDNQYLLPTSITQCDPLGQKSTNAKVLAYLLQPENDVYLCSQETGGPRPSSQDLLNLVVNQQPQIQVFLDVGAQILDMRNHELVQKWLELRKDMPAAIFFDENDHMKVMTQDGTIEAFISSPYNQQLSKCLVYLDDVHTRGTDLKLPPRSRAAVTLGPKVTKDRLLQGAMRMRKLGHGQSVLFIAPQEVDRKIREAAGKDSSIEIRSADILRWVLQETCADILHHVPHWCQQGVDYLRRKEDWVKFCASESSNVTDLKRSWLQPEARSLEFMYGPRQQNGWTSANSLPPEIRMQCFKLGVFSLQDVRMEEEQEREVVHEIEREQQVERPPKTKAAKHCIHDSVRRFIQTGKIERHGSAFLCIHIAAKSPSAWSPNLLVTDDFRTTVEGTAAGDYLRPVNWIISSTVQGETVLVVVSPFEVNELLPEIRRSKFVHLHLYAPRVSQTMRSFDDLRFFCIPPLPRAWNPPEANLIQQLNLYAGQLYLPTFSTYQQLCAFLGLYSDAQHVVDGAQIQSDGFVKPTHRQGTLAHLQSCQFERSPLPSLKAHIGHRRKGMSYALTHLGKVLDARLLTPEDFTQPDDVVDETES